jgi:small basic protein
MLIALVGIIIGMLIGLTLTYSYNAAFTIYITLTILILIQSLLRIIKNESIGLNIYKEIILIVSEIIFAGLLAYIGEKLGISLYLAIVLSFGLRIFNDFNLIVKKFIKYDKIN